MITTIKNEQEYIYALSEWWICNVNGQLQDRGEYCQVREMWIHPQWRGVRTLRKLIHDMDKDDFMLNVKWIYWRRDKYGRMSKLFPRGRFLREVLNGKT